MGEGWGLGKGRVGGGLGRTGVQEMGEGLDIESGGVAGKVRLRRS